MLLTKLAGYGGLIVPPQYIAKVGDAEFATHPIGTGPFKVTDYQPKVSVTLDAFPGSFSGAPKLDHVVYRFIVEPDTQVAELQAGRVDIATNVPISLIGVIQKDREAAPRQRAGPDGDRAPLQHRARAERQRGRAPCDGHGGRSRRDHQGDPAGQASAGRELPGQAVVRLRREASSRCRSIWRARGRC